MTTISYTSIDDYITHNIASGLGDVTIAPEQAKEIAHRMTEWKDGKLVERDDVDFWEVVEEVIETWDYDLDTITSYTHLIEASVGAGYRPSTSDCSDNLDIYGDTLADMLADALEYVETFDYSDILEANGHTGKAPEPRFELEELTWDGPNVLVRYADQSEGQYGYLQITANLK